MSAFAMFSLKAPSLLAFDKERAEGNVATIYGMQRVPCDTHRREILDPVSPESLRPVFKSVLQQWQRGKALDAMTFLDGHYLLALDGTEKNDGERHAATHFVAQLRQDYPHLKCIVAEDSLRSNAPHIQTLHDHDLRSILGVKEGDHALLFHQVQVTEHAGGVTYYERHDRAAGLVHRFRLVNDVPLNASNAEVRVNCIEYWEMGAPKLQHFSWITDLRVSKRNVFRLMRGGTSAVEDCK